MGHDVEFIETSVFRMMEALFADVLRLRTTAVVTGAPGVGKTRALYEL